MTKLPLVSVFPNKYYKSFPYLNFASFFPLDLSVHNPASTYLLIIFYWLNILHLSFSPRFRFPAPRFSSSHQHSLITAWINLSTLFFTFYCHFLLFTQSFSRPSIVRSFIPPPFSFSGFCWHSYEGLYNLNRSIFPFPRLVITYVCPLRRPFTFIPITYSLTATHLLLRPPASLNRSSYHSFPFYLTLIFALQLSPSFLPLPYFSTPISSPPANLNISIYHFFPFYYSSIYSSATFVLPSFNTFTLFFSPPLPHLALGGAPRQTLQTAQSRYQPR